MSDNTPEKWTIQRYFLDVISESLGKPTRLQRFVAQNSQLEIDLTEPAQVVSGEHVVAWHNWPPISGFDSGCVQYFTFSNYSHGGGVIYRQDLEHMVERNIIEQWRCDIQDVVGLTASKSSLSKFKTLDEMVMAKSPELIDSISREKLYGNLAHDEVRILPQHGGSDCFARRMWDDGRIILVNSGGSHHFAAARYIARHLGCDVPLSGKLYTYAIRPDAVASLLTDFDLYAIPELEFYNGFLDALRTFRAPVGVYGLPWPYGVNACLVLLPKDQARSMRASEMLRRTGLRDFGQILTSAMNRQTNIM